MSPIPTTTKEVGSPVRRALLALDGLRAGLKLRRTARLLGKWLPVRGFVVMGRTAEEADAQWALRIQAPTSRP